MKEITLNIEGMSCNHCKQALETAIGQLDGVESVEIDLTANTAQIRIDDDSRIEEIKQTVTEAGYSVK
ncbi:MAG: heavy-metal-associated domain-containing protein [Firmicutes bacterium]|nr:heavy-metal-associated domain-containing protein [Bacillota bacterium]